MSQIPLWRLRGLCMPWGVVLLCILSFGLHAASWADPIPPWSDGDPSTAPPILEPPRWDDQYKVWYTYLASTVSGGLEVKMIFVKAGHTYGGPRPMPQDYKTMPMSYVMGSPVDELHRRYYETQHQVDFNGRPIGTTGIWVGERECGQALWRHITGSLPREPEDSEAIPAQFVGTGLPVNNVTYADIQAFLASLSGALGGSRARLPTEEEWEYFARANSTTMYSTLIGTELRGPDYLLTDDGRVITDPDMYFSKTPVTVGAWVEGQGTHVNFGIAQNCISTVDVPLTASITKRAAATELEATAFVEGNFNSSIRNRFPLNDWARLVPIYRYYIIDTVNGGYESVDQYPIGTFRRKDGSTFTGTGSLHVKHWVGGDVVYSRYSDLIGRRCYRFKAGPEIGGLARLDNDNYGYVPHDDGDILDLSRQGDRLFVERYIPISGILYDANGEPSADGDYVASVGHAGRPHLTRAFFNNPVLGDRRMTTTRCANQLHGGGVHSGGYTLANTNMSEQIKNLPIGGSTLNDDLQSALAAERIRAEGAMRTDWQRDTDAGPVNHTACRYTYALGAYGRFAMIDNSTVDAGGIPVARIDLPNAWGLFDIHGNAAELTSTDWDGRADYGVPNASGSNGKVFRGGSWDDGSPSCRSAHRQCLPLDAADPRVGFRLVIE